MKWLSRFFVLLALASLGFGLLKFQSESSASNAKHEFRKSIQQPSETQNSSTPIPLQESLRQYAKRLGFDRIPIRENFQRIKLNTLNGDPVRLGDFDDRWILVNFWASWCMPCRKEMPSLQKLDQRIAGDKFSVLAVNVMESKDKVQKFMTKRELSLPVLLDSKGKLKDHFLIKGLPVSWIIDPSGQPVMRLEGSHEWHSKKFVRLIERIIKK